MRFNPTKTLASVDLSNKVILITGSTSGIGFTTARVLVQHGAKVYLTARNADKAAACINLIEESLEKTSNRVSEGKKTRKGQVLFHHLDLSDTKDAKKSAEEFLEKEKRLDVLINNAAAILEGFRFGANGVQHLMLVNYFSPVVFTNTLLPLLKKTAAESNSDVRIVNVSGDGHFHLPKGLHFKSKDDFNVNYGNSFWQSIKRYNVSKLLEILWTRELQRRLTEEGSRIIVLALHPGVVWTETTRTGASYFSWPFSSILPVVAHLTFKDVLDGAGTPVIAAVSPSIRAEANKYKGAYLRPIGKLAKPSKQAQDDELAREVWATTEELLKEWGL